MGIAKVRTSPYKPSTNRNYGTFPSNVEFDDCEVHQRKPAGLGFEIAHGARGVQSLLPLGDVVDANRIVFGRENTLPADLVLCDVDRLPQSENSVAELVAEQQERFRSAYQLARDHLKVVAQRRKSHYDVGVKAANLP